METSDQDIKILTVLLDILLSALSSKSDGYTYNQSEWTICSQSTTIIPQQRNGFDCGPFAMKAIEYIVAGRQFDYCQNDMTNFRYKILLAMKLQEIPWLHTPTEFKNNLLNDQYIKKTIKDIPKDSKVSKKRNIINLVNDELREDYITKTKKYLISGIIDLVAMDTAIETDLKERANMDKIVDSFDYYPSNVAAPSSPEAVLKASSASK